MQENGADLIEIGIPFSDPVAEGIVIQQADERALAAGTTTDKIFDMLGKNKEHFHVPMVFMTYINVIFVYGIEKFAKRTKEIGMAGVIVPDMPFEEKEELDQVFRRYDLDVISLIAPTSKERIKAIAAEAQGFIYCVSSLGVTGVRDNISQGVAEMVREVKKVKDIPCAVGFGISTPEQAENMAAVSDGVIVGSAIVRIVGEYGRECVEKVGECMKRMKEALG
jgi:tryptophan synthase alpha chain